jgi:hypothetical protein
MSPVSSGIFGALAVTLTFGAIQFASGSDLGSLRKELAPNSPLAASADASAVNRAAKADRGLVASASASDRSQTLSFHVGSLADTSVLVRLPAIRPAAPAKAERATSGPMLSRTERRPTVACEPVVSVLTDVAKLLQPGRCVT